jgi:hypothetical protein
MMSKKRKSDTLNLNAWPTQGIHVSTAERKMRILIACEESQEVTKAFRAREIEAFSCDVLPCSGGHPEWHIECNVMRVLNQQKWDAVIAFPPCTYLSSVGNRHLSDKCNTTAKINERFAKRKEAYYFFLAIYYSSRRIAVENLVGYMNSAFRKPDQIIHPYQFGDPFKKRTCLWLKGLPKLEYTNVLQEPKPLYVSQGKKTMGKKIGFTEGIKGLNHADRKKARAKTFPGIARAMAEQWGDYLIKEL